MQPTDQPGSTERTTPDPREDGFPGVTGPSHTVQFYEDEGSLAESAADFLEAGLRAEQPVVVVATASHLAEFTARLKSRGLDIEGPRARGQFLPVDARELLSRFMVGETPDAQLFSDCMGEVFDRCLAGDAHGNGHTCLRVYGEMVDVLWKDGKRDAAIRLEELWNDLARTRPFSLLCAYAIEHFHREPDSLRFHEVCRHHASVLPFVRDARPDGEDGGPEAAHLRQRAQALEAELEHRRELEHALRDALAAHHEADKARRWLAAIVDSSDDAIVSKTFDGVITSWNRGAERIFGYTAEEAVGRHITLIIPAERRTEEDYVISQVRQGERVDHFETERLTKDGRTVNISLTVSPIKDANGRPIGVSKVARDITERKTAEAERERLLSLEKAAREEAEAANRAKDEFLAVVSHELRTPLNCILGWTKIVSDRQTDSGTTRRALDVIDRNAQLQMRLIEELLDASRIVSGKLQISADPVDLAPIVKTVSDSIRPAIVAKSIELDLRIEDSVCLVTGDAGRLQQVVWNLLTNAVKFTPKAGRVEVRLRQVDSEALLAIRDTGQGISPEFLPHVFDKFRQADDGSARKHGGLGLGLSIVRHLVEGHGGTISADSPGEGRGATFTVRLPLRAVAADIVIGSMSSEPCGLLRDVRVLVVDDNRDARELLQYLLEQSGAAVETVSSAADAISLISSQTFDMLLADMGMPEEDGYDLIAAVRRLPSASARQIPAMAVTSYSDQRARAIAAGYDEYLTKPIEPAHLTQTVATLLGLFASDSSRR